MGIKTPITLEELSLLFPCTALKPSTDGVSDTVYFTDRGVVKLFESASIQEVNEERELLRILSDLPVPQPIGEIFFLHGKPCMAYATHGGTSPQRRGDGHIVQIARFLRRFHDRSAGLSSSNTPLFEPSRLERLIDQAGYPPLRRLFDSIDLHLRRDGVIHGDLFPDNTLFHEEKLEAVLDFSEACEGDFMFDLAVVAISWCLDDAPDLSRVDLLLTHYNRGVCPEELLAYMRYALLYYATTRYLAGRDYQSLLERFDHLTTITLKGTIHED